MSGGAAENVGRRRNETTMGADRRIEAARGYLTLDMPEHALRELSHVPEAGLYRAEGLRLRGDALRALAQYEEASAVYTRTLAEWPDCLPALMGAAICYRRLGQLGRAVAAVEDANRLHPNEPAVLFALARFYVLTGETPRAMGWLGRAVRICPEVAGWAEADDDFGPLKGSPHFQLLMDAAKDRQRA
jgi:tetratricopeptide (TPR) repeat protein